jgi:hypothetical protein
MTMTEQEMHLFAKIQLLYARETKWHFELITPKADGLKLNREGFTGTVMFVNLGATTATINKQPLLPNSAMALDGSSNTYDTTSWNIICDIPNGVLGVWMIAQKYTGKIVRIDEQVELLNTNRL